jgi:hypothetical protein
MRDVSIRERMLDAGRRRRINANQQRNTAIRRRIHSGLPHGGCCGLGAVMTHYGGDTEHGRRFPVEYAKQGWWPCKDCDGIYDEFLHGPYFFEHLFVPETDPMELYRRVEVDRLYIIELEGRKC